MLIEKEAVMARTARNTAVVDEAPAPETEAVETVETPAETEAPAEVAPVMLDATKLDAEVEARYGELLPFLTLAGRKDRKVGVELRVTPEPRMRMVCSWGRKSYFAPVTELGEGDMPVIPAQVKAALLRQIDREFGRAIRVIKTDEKKAKRLATLVEKRKAAGKTDDAAETAETETAEA